MVVKADIQTKIVPTEENTVAKNIHIILGDELSIDRGDTIVVSPFNRSVIEIIKGKRPMLAPYYSKY